MESSRQSFPAARIIARIPTDWLSHLWDCFTSREKKAWGQRPDARPWISVLRAIIRGTQVTLPFFLAITLDQRICPPALHFSTLHKGHPRRQGMLSHKTALSLRSELSPGRGRFCRERKDWKLDSLAVLRSLKFPFKETPHFSWNWEEKSKHPDQFLERQGPFPISSLCHKDAEFLNCAGCPPPAWAVSPRPAEPVSRGRAEPSTCRALWRWHPHHMVSASAVYLAEVPESQHQQIFFCNVTAIDFRGKGRPAQGPTGWYKIPRSTETGVTRVQQRSGACEMKLLKQQLQEKLMLPSPYSFIF